MDIETYNGFPIRFDSKKEVWYALVNEDSKPAEYDSIDNRIENASLKKLKELLDLIRRKKFSRIPVFVRARTYRKGGGDDKKYEPQYTEATLTSISPNGNAYTVIKGEKHGDKTNIRWHSTSIILDTPENRKIIKEIDEAGRKEWEAEVEQKSLRGKLKFLDGKKVYKEIYGKELDGCY